MNFYLEIYQKSVFIGFLFSKSAYIVGVIT